MIQKKKLGFFSAIERNVLIRWLWFSRRHRDSHKLPFYYFFFLFMDAFVMVIPSTLFLMACVTISPKRWKLFAFLFPLAATLNNTVTYFLGTLFPHEFFMRIVTAAHLQNFWKEATEAILHYGPWATFIGSIIGLPTQMITALIGLADSSPMDPEIQKVSIVPALLLVFVGQGLKSFAIAFLVRYGWLKFERKHGG